MMRNIKADLYRYGKQTSILLGFKEPGFRYMYFLRKAAVHKKRSFLGLFFHFIVRRLSHKYGFQIPVSTSIGEGFYIGHFGTIVINEKATIGKNCNIAHNITIGQANRGKLKGVPTIGDMVWIGTGAVIVGNITIANNVLIAPNAYVNFDVPEGSIVLGNPAKIINRDNPTLGYINNILS
ncbi:serine O-acetyltransferase [Psychroserpens ponticola]|uniref:Serine acetyltransferase n=1 Tax=Psychroserpens ponticola TaxID=2932268 RepID=A0ABY7S1T8_9FLAO|nr:serine acetyltransferase [Psychroserpens ponticola]WCO03103.1 serine acetyltransferase [Psychroserpens ponticola]